MYPKLSGMTGTAATEAAEFFDIYKMNVVNIPTNVPIARIDDEDEFYKNITDKFGAIAKTIREANERGQPVLVGTVSIEKSELLSSYLEKEGVAHSVLNARFHESEAHIVAQAGRTGAVTIATNMAGRGTDIKLGGNEEFRIDDELKDVPEGPEREAGIARITAEVAAEREAVKAAGGLFVLATERHESRRIDNQLRGRSGRQGDPGLSKFYLCLDDDLLRIFGPDTLFSKMMNKNLEDGEAIGSKWLSKAIETAQKKVEARNYDIRKQVVEYDDVMNDQRKVIYEQRADIMDSETVDDVDDRDARRNGQRDRRRCLPAGQLSRTVEHRADEGTGRQISSTSIRRSMTGCRKTRSIPKSRGTIQALADADRGRKGGAGRSGHLEGHRKVDAAPDARSSLERASGDARRAASGRLPARLCAETADQRI